MSGARAAKPTDPPARPPRTRAAPARRRATTAWVASRAPPSGAPGRRRQGLTARTAFCTPQGPVAQPLVLRPGGGGGWPAGQTGSAGQSGRHPGWPSSAGRRPPALVLSAAGSALRTLRGVAGRQQKKRLPSPSGSPGSGAPGRPCAPEAAAWFGLRLGPAARQGGSAGCRWVAPPWARNNLPNRRLDCC